MANIFLKLTDVEGESKDASHGAEIEVQSFSWGLTQSGTTHGSGGGGGIAMHVQDLSFTKLADKATPTLMKFCANGKHIAEGILTVRKAGETPQDFCIYTMKEIIVSSVQTGGSGDAAQMHESASLNFAEVKVEYKKQEDDGSLGAGTETTINVPMNQVS
jgi:type VI secretion system secreted protein Hcp